MSYKVSKNKTCLLYVLCLTKLVKIRLDCYMSYVLQS